MYIPNFHSLDRLVEEGYLRKVISPCGKLALYNYTDHCTYDRKWNKHTLNSRGNIYEIATGKVIARAFPKFFNFEELPTSKSRNLFKQTDFDVYDKADGSLGILYNYDKVWRVNTRGSFSSEQAIKASGIVHKKYNLEGVQPFITLLAEIIYPENRIILDYGDEEKLVLLAAFNSYTGNELSRKEVEDISRITDMPIINQTSYGSIEALIAAQKTLGVDVEGFVVRFTKTGERVKFKSKEYLKLARLMAYVTPLHFWEHMVNGEIDKELLKQIPEELRDISEEIRKGLERDYRDMRTQVYSDVNSVIEKTKDAINQKKEVGLLAKRGIYAHAAAAFLVLNEQSDKIDAYILKRIRPKGNELIGKPD